MKGLLDGRRQLVAGIGLVAVLLALPMAASSLTTVSLAGVPADALEARGITLTSPTNLPDRVLDRNAAETAAMAEIPGAQAVDATLASVTDESQPGMTGRLAWVVSLVFDRAIGHAGSYQSARVAYTVVFLDATSGTLLFGIQGGSI